MKRVALLGFSIECNRFAPIATEADFRGRTWFEGEALLAEARSGALHMLAEMPGFIADMDRSVGRELGPGPHGQSCWRWRNRTALSTTPCSAA